MGIGNGLPPLQSMSGPSGDSFSPHLERVQRPAVIEEDLWSMERRGRVQEVLAAQDFCGTLEEQIADKRLLFSKQYTPGAADSLVKVRENSEDLKRFTRATPPTAGLVSHTMQPVNPVIPICDIFNTGSRAARCPEQANRNALASLYRLVDLLGWTQGIYNHITLRVPSKSVAGGPEVLINPFGLLYHEVTASSFLRINLAGDVLDRGSTLFGYNKAGYMLHSAIHGAREDVNCVLHIHTPAVSAVSSMKCGLLPICQEALIVGPVAYHDYEGILTDEQERKSIVEDLGDKNVMLLRNHGLVVCGRTVEEALHLVFHVVLACKTQVLILQGGGTLVCATSLPQALQLATHMVRACEHQIKAMRAGLDNLIIPSEAAITQAYETAKRGGGGVNVTQSTEVTSNGEFKEEALSANREWGVGELEWEAWMRRLDAAGYCTGHRYRLLRFETPSPPIVVANRYPLTSHRAYHSAMNLSEIATPPSCSSVGAVDESSEISLAHHRQALLQKERERMRWSSSPNTYQRIRFFESGTDNPRLLTKWVRLKGGQNASSQSTPVKINQFSLPNSSSREMLWWQRQLKEDRLTGAITAGPTSNVLDSAFTARSHQDRGQEMASIGAASKGIITRPHQHNAQVYRQLYAPNPFRSDGGESVQAYLREVEQKSRSACSTLERRIPLTGPNGTHQHTFSNGSAMRPIKPSATTMPISNLNRPMRSGITGSGEEITHHRTKQEPPVALPRWASQDVILQERMDSQADKKADYKSAKKRGGIFSFIYRTKQSK